MEYYLKIIRRCRERSYKCDLQLNARQIGSITLFEIASILQKMGRSLNDIEGMITPNSSISQNVINPLIYEELDYDKEKLKITTNLSAC